jgi:hypothetical protein
VLMPLAPSADLDGRRHKYLQWRHKSLQWEGGCSGEFSERLLWREQSSGRQVCQVQVRTVRRFRTRDQLLHGIRLSWQAPKLLACRSNRFVIPREISKPPGCWRDAPVRRPQKVMASRLSRSCCRWR